MGRRRALLVGVDGTELEHELTLNEPLVEWHHLHLLLHKQSLAALASLSSLPSRFCPPSILPPSLLWSFHPTLHCLPSCSLSPQNPNH